MPNPDRLYISADVRELLRKMEGSNFLNSVNSSRRELFTYAMALGLEAPTSISGKQDGLFLAKDLGLEDEALFFVCALSGLKDIDKITDKAQAYDYVQRCANTGFKVVDSQMCDGSLETIDKRMIAELDQIYLEIVKK